jgi:hypothetical protein
VRAVDFTCSYYYDGLTLQEFVDALMVLLRMGRSAQQSFYNEWLELSRASLAEGKLSSTTFCNQLLSA